MHNRFLNFFYCLIAVGTSLSASAGIKVYVSHDSPITKVSKQEIINIYLKRTTYLNNQKIHIFDNADSSKEFYLKVIDKTQSQLHAYWMKEIFLGQNIPPKTIEQKNILKHLQENKFTIIYSLESIDAKVIYED